MTDTVDESEPDFVTQAHGKWILAGEHAVLRGHGAIVFPIASKSVRLSYWQNADPLDITFDAPYGETLLLMFWGILESGLKLVDHSRTQLTGQFRLENNIPMGAGMGFSAALCVALGRWFVWQGWLKEQALFDFARQLEDHFHGKSSGIDIAGALHDQGVYFELNNTLEPLTLAWQPKLYLSFSQQISITASCVKRVNDLIANDAVTAKEIDAAMQQSVIDAKQALSSDERVGLDLLANAINTAKECFAQWGLITGNLATHLQQLWEHPDMIAAKPTGAGDGGYVLSLWREAPPESLDFELIPIF